MKSTGRAGGLIARDAARPARSAGPSISLRVLARGMFSFFQGRFHFTSHARVGELNEGFARWWLRARSFGF
jgi:hypothetical protein